MHPPFRNCPLLVVVVTLAVGCAGTQPADLALVNGNIITVDPGDRRVQAAAIRDGHIVAVGSNEEIETLVGTETRRIDLEGQTATPGLIDAHAHFASGGVDRLYVMDLSYPGVKNIADIVVRVSEAIAKAEPGEWIVGAGWDEGKLEELRYVDASDLDPVSPNNPVWLVHTMGHYGTANNAALKLAGISRDTTDPAGGIIDRTDRGTPTGVMKETAQRLVSQLIPSTTPDQLREGIREMAAAFNAEGMTGVKDPGISQPAWQAYQDVLADGDLTVRTFVLWRGGRTLAGTKELLDRIGPTTRPAEKATSDYLVSGGVKLFADGSGGARTAWMYDEWSDRSTGVDTGNRGYPGYDSEVLRAQIRMIHDAGIHIGTHAVGDRAIDWVIDSYWAALQANPLHGLRHSIIHMNVPTDHAIERTAEMQEQFDAAYPEPSATFMWWIGDTYAGNFGPARALRLNPFRTFLESGIRWAATSDYSVTPFAARYGIWSTVARETVLGVYGDNPWGMAESVDVRTALKSYTIWAARQLFMEDQVGSIEVGKRADIAVWDRDPYSAATADLKDMRCLMTIFDGNVVFTAPE